MEMRHIVRQFIKFEVGDENNIHLWLDWWHPAGILIQKFGFCFVWSMIPVVAWRLGCQVSYLMGIGFGTMLGLMI